MKRINKALIFLVIKIIIIVLSFYLVSKYIFGIFIVKNNNYRVINITPHDLLIYYKLNNDYQNNDIVFYNGKIFRVIGTNGQIIDKRGNKIFIDSDIIDGVEYEFDYPYTISKNELFLISNQEDSKTIGCINKNDINGKLIFRIQIRNF